MQVTIRTVLLLALAALLSGCAAPVTVGTSCASSSKGALLYNENCSACHGRLTDTDRLGRSAARIRSAITNNIGGMGFLSGLSVDDINAIGECLKVEPGE